MSGLPWMYWRYNLDEQAWDWVTGFDCKFGVLESYIRETSLNRYELNQYTIRLCGAPLPLEAFERCGK